ncbi:NAD-dependent epimerase/dehydratase family protein [Kordiimonas gwangyangensis]|uniref:NAD-dependent epimerase/dehydratase family protein n=1 Tax=Kordiimonas gwangyangensis TaxID=288022 RepID=UPI00036315C9|nr:NAD-dependent epimerase/dehydratase family protein [Kordiimonas gwangyangensis]
MIFILGGDGFIGSAYARALGTRGEDYAVINRSNYASFVGQGCDVLINANGNSKKFLSARDPVWDFDASVTSVVRSLHDFKVGKYVYLSSGDVYEQTHEPALSREDVTIDPARLSVYGRHKFFAEAYVRAAGVPWLVVRQSGFVGTGLKKNAIFDMMYNQKVWLSRTSNLQFNSVDRSAEQVLALIAKGYADETVNVSAPGTVNIGDIYDHIGSKSEFEPGASEIQYELSTEKLRAMLGTELATSAACVQEFLDERS